MFDLITIGDSTIDTFVPLTEAKVSVAEGEPKLILPFGDKVPVGPPTSTVGGNAANSAVGSARLKLKTAIYTSVGNAGDDRDDDRIKNKLKKEGVDTRYVIESDELPSEHHIVLTYQGERTILVYHQPWRYNLPELEKTKWVYYTSLAPHFPKTDIVPQICSYLERSGAKLLYNPGTFQIKYGVKKFPRLLSLTEVFITNLEEAKIILGFKEGEKIAPKKLLSGIADLGPRLVVITDGGEGSYGFDGQKYFKLGVFPANLVEMTGAGDAFATGVLSGLFHGNDLSEAMRWGAANGAAVAGQFGPQTGLLTYSKMQEKLKENSGVKAKEI